MKDNFKQKAPQIYIPRHFHNFSSLFKNMSSASTPTKSGTPSPENAKSVAEDKSDTFDSILQKLQDLSVSSEQEEQINDNKTEV
jgi:hypothetical protein